MTNLYTIIDKKTNKPEIMLIKNWGIIPTFSKKKHAIQFIKEKSFPKELKVIKLLNNVKIQKQKMVEKIRKESYKEGYDEGYDVGYMNGETDGYDEGAKNGYDEGKFK